MAACAPIRLLSSASSSPWPPQDPSPRSAPPFHAWPSRHRHLRAARCALSPPPPSLDLPLLPFQPAEVLIPSESKTLHLYEARYIALLEEALYKRKNSFVHFVLDPVVDSSTKASFAVRYGCLVHIESVQKLDIGALISIRGVCRVNISNLLDMEPYFRGTVSPKMDEPYDAIQLGARISKLKESMCNLHSLQMKLKVQSLSFFLEQGRYLRMNHCKLTLGHHYCGLKRRILKSIMNLLSQAAQNFSHLLRTKQFQACQMKNFSPCKTTRYKQWIR